MVDGYTITDAICLSFNDDGSNSLHKSTLRENESAPVTQDRLSCYSLQIAHPSRLTDSCRYGASPSFSHFLETTLDPLEYWLPCCFPFIYPTHC